jgi:hypothetical protein
MLGQFDQFARTDGLGHHVRGGTGGVDRLQALDRVGDVGADFEPHPGKHRLALLFSLAVHGNRRRGDQALLGQFALHVQVAAQAAGTHRQHHVVDRGAIGEAADGLEVRQRETARLEHAMRRDFAVEACHRKLVRAADEFAGKGARRRLQRGPAARQRLGDAQREGGDIESGAQQQAEVARRRLGEPGRGRRGRRRIGREVVQQRGDLVALGDIDRGVVDLEQHGEAADRQVEEAVEPLDHVHLPQRTVEIEGAGVDARGLDAELAPVTGLGQGDVAHVVFDVEVLVLDPVGIVEVERHAQDLLAEHRQLAEPAFDMGQDLLEAHLAARRGGLVVDVQQGDVGIGVSAVGVDVGGVVFAELAHACPSVR